LEEIEKRKERNNKIALYLLGFFVVYLFWASIFG